MNVHSLSGLLALAFLTAAAPTASAQRADALVRSDLAFAEGLASRYRYADLAESVVEAVERGGVSENLSEGVALSKCGILGEGARYSADPVERLELHRKALDAYQTFLDDYPYSELGSRAERAFVDITNRYGRLLEDALQDAVGEEATTLREEIKGTLDTGLDRVRDLIDVLENQPTRSPSEEQELQRYMLGKGQMLTTRALISEDGTFYFAQAEENLENLAISAGDESPAGLQAYLQLAKVKSAQGIYDEAADFAEFVVNTLVPMDPADREGPGWLELPFEAKQRRWDLVQLGMPELLRAYSEGGDSERAVGAALYFYNAWKSEGFEIGPLGHLSLLSVSSSLLEAGGFIGGSLVEGDLQWFEANEDMAAAGFRSSRNARSSIELALRIAQDVNEANRGNVLQVRAQKLISEVIDRPGVDVSPEVLYEAAEGEYFARNYASALSTYKRLMGALERQDEATRLDQMPRALNGIGRSLSKLERPLEAAMAFREAATVWKGDPEYQRQNADGYYKAIRVVKNDAEGDAKIEQMHLEAENLVAQAAAAEGGAGEIHWRRGERLYGEKDYTGAREEYLQVDPGEDIYEKARSKAALCLHKQGDTQAAKTEFQDYLENYVPDPAQTVTTKGKIDNRAQASAMATYYMGVFANKEGQWDDVLRWLATYDTDFGTQTEYAVRALRLVVKAHIAKNELGEVRGVLERMKERYAEHPVTGGAAGDAAGALVPLIDAALKDENVAETMRLKRERAELLELGNSLGRSPGYAGLRNESTLWIELREWEKAETALRKLIDGHGDDPANEDKMQNRVLPDLGLALLEQKRVPEAFEVLEPLVPDPDDEEDKRKPRSETVTTWCRAICGWVEGDADSIVEVPGIGDEDLFRQATDYWLKLESVAERDSKWECPWYELKFQSFYAYYRWGQLDSAKLKSTKESIENLRQVSQDPELRLVAEECGDEVLRKRFLWLWDKVR